MRRLLVEGRARLHWIPRSAHRQSTYGSLAILRAHRQAASCTTSDLLDTPGPSIDCRSEADTLHLRFKTKCSIAWIVAAGGAAGVAAVAGVSEVRCDSGTKPASAQRDHQVTVYEDHVASQDHLLKPTEHNPTPTTSPPPIAALSGHHLRHRQVALVIGLPFRGQAHLSRRMKRYLEFFHGARVELFNVNDFMGRHGQERMLEALREFFEAGEVPTHGASDVTNPSAGGRFAILYASDTLDAISSMWSGHSKWRRRWMKNTLQAELDAHICFIELKVDETAKHIKQYEERLARWRGLELKDVEGQIKRYQEHFVPIQDDGSEDDLAYMSLINYNQKVVTNNMLRSFLGARMAQFLASVHPYGRVLYLTRHGESQYNAEKKIGGDSSLSSSGREYAKRLAEFADLVVCGQASNLVCVSVDADEIDSLRGKLTRVPADGKHGGLFAKGNWGLMRDSAGQRIRDGMLLKRVQCGNDTYISAPVTVNDLLQALAGRPATLIFVDGEGPALDPVPARLWTSTLRRTKETAEHIYHPVVALPDGKMWLQMSHNQYRNLDEVYAGEYEGLTYEEIKKREPFEAELRKLDKLGYRYPRGESYYDIIARLDDRIQQLETYQEPILIISHQAVLRLIYAFLMGIPREQASELEIPLHTVIRIEFDGSSDRVAMKKFELGPSKKLGADGQRHL